MLRKDFILCKTKKLLSEFMFPIMNQADRPRQKFLRQTVGAILLCGSLVVTEFARWIHDDCSDIFYRLKRLLNHLVSTEGNLTAAAAAYRRSVARFIQYDTPIPIDITDLAKPRARKLKYLDLVRDGSEKKLVPGYWCVEVYAHLENKRVLPLALDVFSVHDPAVGGQNLQVYKAIEAVNRDIGGKGVWVGDRGFDGLNYYEMWFSLKCNFVVRQRGDRHVVAGNGVHILVRDLIEHLRQNTAMPDCSSNIVFYRVHLPDNHKPLYLVASWLSGIKEPLILLTTLVVENYQQARGVIWYYKQRWVCEEATRFLKEQVGFERFRIRRYEAIQRLAILAMFAMGFLTWILLRNCQLVKGLFSLTSRFRKQAKFTYYRLLDGLQTFGLLHRLRFSKITITTFKNG